MHEPPEETMIRAYEDGRLANQARFHLIKRDFKAQKRGGKPIWRTKLARHAIKATRTGTSARCRLCDGNGYFLTGISRMSYAGPGALPEYYPEYLNHACPCAAGVAEYVLGRQTTARRERNADRNRKLYPDDIPF